MANKLSQERIDMLNEINFVWSMRNKRASPASAKATTPPPAKRQRRGSTSSTATIVSVEEEPVPIKSKKKQQKAIKSRELNSVVPRGHSKTTLTRRGSCGGSPNVNFT